jgi:malonate transporter
LAPAELAAALLPVAILIGLGCALGRGRLLSREGWAAVERLVYFVLFPALLFQELVRAEFQGQPVFAFGSAVLLAQLAMAGIAALLRRPLAVPGPSHSSVLQCMVRWNSYVALALAPALFGPAASSLAALAVAVMVPAGNVLSVLALARHGGRAGTTLGVAGLLRALVTNPLLIACALGIAFNLAGLRLPQVAAESLAMLARTTLALGLLTVGAGLQLGAVVGRPGLILLATFGSLVIKPLLACILARLFGVQGTALGVAVLVSAVPTATTGYILARLMGGDAELMAALITATTAGAFVTLPLVLLLLR